MGSLGHLTFLYMLQKLTFGKQRKKRNQPSTVVICLGRNLSLLRTERPSPGLGNRAELEGKATTRTGPQGKSSLCRVPPTPALRDPLLPAPFQPASRFARSHFSRSPTPRTPLPPPPTSAFPNQPGKSGETPLPPFPRGLPSRDTLRGGSPTPLLFAGREPARPVGSPRLCEGLSPAGVPRGW